MDVKKDRNATVTMAVVFVIISFYIDKIQSFFGNNPRTDLSGKVLALNAFVFGALAFVGALIYIKSRSKPYVEFVYFAFLGYAISVGTFSSMQSPLLPVPAIFFSHVSFLSLLVGIVGAYLVERSLNSLDKQE